MLPCVYILSSKRNGTLYIGVTSNLTKRVWEHKNKVIKGFSKKYAIDQLVWYEVSGSILSAIKYEKKIKKWRRKWKVALIEESNPYWNDLYDSII